MTQEKIRRLAIGTHDNMICVPWVASGCRDVLISFICQDTGTWVGYRLVRKKSPLPPKYKVEISTMSIPTPVGGLFFRTATYEATGQL